MSHILLGEKVRLLFDHTSKISRTDIIRCKKRSFSSNLFSEINQFHQHCIILRSFFIIVVNKFLVYICTDKIISHSDISKINFSRFQTWKGTLRKIMIRINGLSIDSLAVMDRFEIDESFYGNHFLVPILL